MQREKALLGCDAPDARRNLNQHYIRQPPIKGVQNVLKAFFRRNIDHMDRSIGGAAFVLTSKPCRNQRVRRPIQQAGRQGMVLSEGEPFNVSPDPILVPDRLTLELIKEIAFIFVAIASWPDGLSTAGRRAQPPPSFGLPTKEPSIIGPQGYHP